jgi:hypothetical protein
MPIATSAGAFGIPLLGCSTLSRLAGGMPSRVLSACWFCWIPFWYCGILLRVWAYSDLACATSVSLVSPLRKRTSVRRSESSCERAFSRASRRRSSKMRMLT